MRLPIVDICFVCLFWLFPTLRAKGPHSANDPTCPVPGADNYSNDNLFGCSTRRDLAAINSMYRLHAIKYSSGAILNLPSHKVLEIRHVIVFTLDYVVRKSRNCYSRRPCHQATQCLQILPRDYRRIFISPRKKLSDSGFSRDSDFPSVQNIFLALLGKICILLRLWCP